MLLAWLKKITAASEAKPCAVQQYGQNAPISTACTPTNQAAAARVANEKSVSELSPRVAFCCWLILSENVLMKNAP